MNQASRLPDIGDIVDDLLVRQPEHHMVPTLERVAAVMELLGDPQRSLQVVHITGTNGKTSTARMVEALLRAAGLRTGLYTSPHLHQVTERICIDGEAIADEAFVAAYEDVAPYVAMVDTRQEDQGRPGLTFFEVLTCVAFAAFADAPVDVAVVEVGLGGRWDATNVADGRVNVITPVAVDHAAWLGDTPAQIAEEKSHIIKAHSVAVLAQQTPEVRQILLDRCTRVSARSHCYGDDFGLTSRAVAVGGQVVALQGLAGVYDEVFLPLMGRHQGENAAVAVAAVEALLTDGQPLDRAIVDALGSVVTPGRLELVAREPAVLVDAAHNPAGIDALASALSDSYHFTDVVVVLSTMADKDLAGILSGLGSVASVLVVTRNSSPRAAPAESVAAMAGEMYGEGRVVVERDFDDAMATAVSLAAERGGVVLATGSVVTAADAARWVVERGADG